MRHAVGFIWFVHTPVLKYIETTPRFQRLVDFCNVAAKKRCNETRRPLRTKDSRVGKIKKSTKGGKREGITDPPAIGGCAKLENCVQPSSSWELGLLCVVHSCMFAQAWRMHASRPCMSRFSCRRHRQTPQVVEACTDGTSMHRSELISYTGGANMYKGCKHVHVVPECTAGASMHRSELISRTYRKFRKWKLGELRRLSHSYRVSRP
jgi:hypothetical protein